ncbi:hypothetical protein MPRG_17350 [Mycobacterium paragordonae]|uniref:Type I restriction modification DNA specificity domain-containing protein n=2 Tax=Mycobacterium paragordonae TaxID=1389713 RepID=A0ABQ1C2K9_9MYCO|nr:hypothetical protein MPRG_17350 [Mycobacterium paragordonae]
MPLIATNCLKEGKREPVFENVRYVDDETYSKWFRAHPEPGDVLFVCKGAPGRVAVVPDPVPFCIAQDMVSLRANRQIADNKYLYYRLRGRDVQSRIENMHVGTMIPHFKKGDFGHLRFSVHESRCEQRAIGEVLGALDDKIAANERIAKAAFELAQSLGRAVLTSRDRLVQRTFGELGQLFDGPHATPTRRSDGPYFLNISSLKGGRLDLAESDHVSEEDFARWTRRVTPEAGDLLFSYETRIGEAALMPGGLRACLGRRMALLRPNRDIVDPVFLLHFYLSAEFQRTVAMHTIHGATVPRIGLATMPDWGIAIPDFEAQRPIAGALGSLHSIMVQAERESDDLARTRDELLPLLMSGKLCVKDAEAVASEVL